MKRYERILNMLDMVGPFLLPHSIWAFPSDQIIVVWIEAHR